MTILKKIPELPLPMPLLGEYINVWVEELHIDLDDVIKFNKIFLHLPLTMHIAERLLMTNQVYRSS